jgi:hypothetical protein
MPLPVPLAFITTVEPFNVIAPVVFPALKVLPAPLAKTVFPEEFSVVKAPVKGTVAPMAVEFIPVLVVLKFAELISRLLAPVEILAAVSPDMFKIPEVAVRFKAPVVSVRPLLAVIVPAEVIVPAPVVEIFPGVDKVPASVMVSVVELLLKISKAVLFWALVSFITSDGAVPALVNEKDVGLVKLPASVKAMFLLSAVVIVLPAS